MQYPETQQTEALRAVLTDPLFELLETEEGRERFRGACRKWWGKEKHP